MNLLTKFFFLLFFISLKTQQISPFQKLTDFEQYKNLISHNKLSCVLFFNSITCKDCDLLFSDFLNSLHFSKIIKQFKIHLFLLDLASSESFKEKLFIEEVNFHFYIEDHLISMENFKLFFNQLSEDTKNTKIFGNFIKNVEIFIKHEIDNLTEKVKNIKTMKELIRKNKKIIIYLGKKNKNFKLYQEATLKDIYYRYYHSFDLKIKKFIKNTYKKNLKNDILAVLSNLKKKSITIFKFTRNSRKNISSFLNIQKYPKLRTEADLVHFNKYLTKDKNLILLYIKSNAVNKENLAMYKDLINTLPKGIIYAHSSLSEDFKLNIGSFFKKQNIEPFQESLYFLYNINGRVMVSHMSYDFKKDYILYFIQTFVLNMKKLLISYGLGHLVRFFEKKERFTNEL